MNHQKPVKIGQRKEIQHQELVFLPRGQHTGKNNLEFPQRTLFSTLARSIEQVIHFEEIYPLDQASNFLWT